MSTINCDACNELREYAPEFVQNGVTTNVATSLKNDTGFNNSLTVAHTDCEDLNDANDCLIGRMDQEIEAYEVCDWKTFMHKLLPNFYELLKAIIASICGLWTNVHNLWTRTDRLCTSIDGLLGLIRGSLPTPHYGEWTEKGYSQLTPASPWDKTKYRPVLYADMLNGFGCTAGRKLGRYSLGITYTENVYPLNPTFTMTDYYIGDIWGSWKKEDIVPTYMTERVWESLMRGFNTIRFSVSGNKTIYLRLRGYITIDGNVFNQDLADDFGEDVIVAEVSHVVGGEGTGPFSGVGDANIEIKSYDA